MSAWLHWIDDRTGLRGAVQGCRAARIPGRASWCRVWPGAIGFAFCVQVITGFCMWIYYSPSAQTAWESVYYLQYHVAGGWLLRAMHHWSAQAMLVLIGVYAIQMIALASYRPPRELVFGTVVLMGLVCLGLLLTGDLLAWDQNSYASTKVRVGFLQLLPWIGGALHELAVGGPQFGHLTLTRFLVLHICCLSGSFLLLLLLHVLLVRRADSAEAAEADETVPFWPHQAARNAVAMIIVLAVVLLLSARHGLWGDERGVELGSPADTSRFFAAARPEWAFRGLYQFARLFPGGKMEILPVFVIPGLLLLVTLAMPWIARRRGGHPFNLLFVGSLLLGVGALSFISLWKDLNDEAHQAALEAERQQAERVRQLACVRGEVQIPPTGALTLLRNDPKTQGPILFETHCAGCHDYLDAAGEGIKAAETSAPNLYGYATPTWIAGWFNPDTITGDDYFGKTKFNNGDMVDNVRQMYEEVDPSDPLQLQDLKEDLGLLAAGLSARAGRRAPGESSANDAALAKEAETLIRDFACTGCHKFHDQGRLGTAPDLTGYASREWTIAVISNPADRRFYGERNDRMPAYAESAEDPTKNILSGRQIGLLTDWLRGQWYRE